MERELSLKQKIVAFNTGLEKRRVLVKLTPIGASWKNPMIMPVESVGLDTVSGKVTILLRVPSDGSEERKVFYVQAKKGRYNIFVNAALTNPKLI